MKSNSRFYKNEMPEIDGFVMAKLVKIEPEGARCILLEYNDMEAFMPISQFSRKWMRSIRQVAKAGNEEILQVINIDPNNGAIDLSKKMLTDDDIEAAESFYQKSRKYHNMMRRVADLCDVHVLKLYETFGWKLYDDNQQHPLEVLEESLGEITTENGGNGEKFWERYEIPPEFKSAFITTINRRIHLVPQKYETEVSLSCYESNGINMLQNTFKNFHEFFGVMPIIKTPPYYIMSIVSLQENEALEQLKTYSLELEKLCLKNTVSFSVILEPHITNE